MPNVWYSTAPLQQAVKRTCREKSGNDSRELTFVNGRELKLFLALKPLQLSRGETSNNFGDSKQCAVSFSHCILFFFNTDNFCNSFRWHIIMATQRAHLLLDGKSICRASNAPTTPNNTRLVEEVKWPLHITPLESIELHQTPSTPLKVS